MFPSSFACLLEDSDDVLAKELKLPVVASDGNDFGAGVHDGVHPEEERR